MGISGWGVGVYPLEGEVGVGSAGGGGWWGERREAEEGERTEERRQERAGYLHRFSISSSGEIEYSRSKIGLALYQRRIAV